MIKISLPSYVINFDEIIKPLEEKLKDVVIRGIRDLKGTQRVKGFAQSIPAIQAEYKILTWAPDKNIVLTGITYSQTGWKSEDYWELWVDGDRIFETVYTKELGEQKHWEVLHPIHANQTIKLVLNNKSGNSRDVWVDIEYLELIGDIEEISETNN